VKYYLGFVNKAQGIPHDKLGSGWCGEAFGKQRAAIIFEGPWVVPYMAQNFPKVGYTVSAMPKGKVNATLGFTVSYSIARDSKNKDEAWTLVSWLTGKTGMRVWTEGGIALPSRTDVRSAGEGQQDLRRPGQVRAPVVVHPGLQLRLHDREQRAASGLPVEGKRRHHAQEDPGGDEQGARFRLERRGAIFRVPSRRARGNPSFCHGPARGSGTST
jgi:hypothetical protein